MTLKTIYSLTIHALLLAGCAHLGGIFDGRAWEDLPQASSAPIYTRLGELPARGLPGDDVSLIQELNRRGVPVVLGSCHQEGVAGLYEARNNVVVVCTSQDTEGLSDTLRHEAVHAAQDCLAGQDNTRLALLNPEANPFHTGEHLTSTDELVKGIKAVYPEQVWALEWEAISLARSRTSSHISDLVATSCS
jgi:hypothetical protein